MYVCVCVCLSSEISELFYFALNAVLYTQHFFMCKDIIKHFAELLYGISNWIDVADVTAVFVC